ncbi:conserved hypothetical protein [Ricinus communis]|uniref:Uncharacterized protein n=1 Tax=Ricinus communis TaxID=3988 RepID=B9T6J1_RICCO|nr:conserved hypothetical protein [Ricinus communis]
MPEQNEKTTVQDEGTTDVPRNSHEELDPEYAARVDEELANNPLDNNEVEDEDIDEGKDSDKEIVDCEWLTDDDEELQDAKIS